MKPKISLSISLLLLSALSLLSAKPKEPAWLSDYRAVFPDDTYIAQKAAADKAERARTEAVAQIARYFKTSVSANLKTSMKSVSSGETVSEETTVENDVSLSSDVSLFAVETTEPYYLKKEKKWHCVAFIERAKAWEQYQPTVEGAKTEFYSMKKNADEESDPFEKCALLSNAWESGKVLLEKLEYARILDAKKEAAYEDDRKAASGMPGEIAKEKEKCTVYIYVSGDYGSNVSSALSKTLARNGLKIAKNESEAAYIASAAIEDNAVGSEPVSIYPSLEFKIESKAGKTVCSSEVKMESKTVSYTLDNARKKAYPILADELDKAVSEELNKKFK